MKLSTVIHAYNKEEALAAFIGRCPAEWANSVREIHRVEAVGVIAVNAGRLDRAVEVTGHFRDITLIPKMKNRG